MGEQAGGRGISISSILAALLVLAAGPALAGDGEWTIRFEPVYMEVYGHDQHVLYVEARDLDADLRPTEATAINLDTDGGLAYRARFQYSRDRWNWGVDGMIFLTSQDAPSRTESPSGDVDQIRYEFADYIFYAGPGETAYFRVLEDTDLQMWTLDLFGERTMYERGNGVIRMLLGLRLGDFDNDFHGVAGDDGDGTLVDASSNYDLMMGPVVGATAEYRFGKQSIHGYAGQSVLLGEAELTNVTRYFNGPFGESPEFYYRHEFGFIEDVAIPVTEFRIKWGYDLTRHLTLGAGFESGIWWEVPVPPGVIPDWTDSRMLDENTIVLFGLSVSARYRF